jgi:hypothetical protein
MRHMSRWMVPVLVVGLLWSSRAFAQTSAPPPNDPTTTPPEAYPPTAGYPPPPPGYPPPGVYAPPAMMPQPPPREHPRHVFSLTISPIHLFLPVVELTGEARVHDKVGVALIGGVGKYTDPDDSSLSASVWEAGGQVRAYVIGDFRHGMQIGGELLYLHLDSTTLAATGEGLAVGPFLGYKIATDVGFTFDAQVGFEHISARAKSTTGPEMANGKSFIPLLNLNVGWSF